VFKTDCRWWRAAGSASVFAMLLSLTIAGCGGGGAKSLTAETPVATPVTPTPGGGGTVTTATASVKVALTDPSTGAARTSISSGSPAKVSASVKDAAGAAVAGAVVTFSTDSNFATLTPSSGTALTDSGGLASVTMAVASVSANGAATISASTQIPDSKSTGGSAEVIGSTGYVIGAANISLSNPLLLGLSTLSAFGTTSVTATVLDGGALFTTPLGVSFSSPCASNGKAVLTPTVTTINGLAIASYLDNGCAGPDTITATVGGLNQSASNTLIVLAPATGSIQFVSAVPKTITLKGTGGAGLQETARVTFKVVDVAGNPIGGKSVAFALSTTLGGISLTSSSAISDAITGQVVTGVQSGTFNTPVRVKASTGSGSTTLATQSDQLTITTGIPTQPSFSFSASTFNIEGWEVDGAATILTARMADHFGNPVPDDTAVNFISEGGKVEGSCLTTTRPSGSGNEGGVCSVTLVSQNLRPTNGRVTVLAFAIGEEGFTDLNSNGWADMSPNELVDANGNSTDLGEAFVDFNENGVRDANEPFVDFNNDKVFQAVGDGKFNGVLCDENVPNRSSPGTCSSTKSLHVRGDVAIVLSGSHPVITTEPSSVQLDVCTGGTPFPNVQKTLTFTLSDLHGNVMPAGTKVEFATTNGKIIGQTGDYPVGNSNACMDAGNLLANVLLGPVFDAALCPASAPRLVPYTVVLKSDATQDKTTLECTNADSTGFLSIKITTPGGTATTASVDVND
jgi:hypothetical protein